MRFTLKHLAYFVAAAEAGSIKIAARRVNISQPSISSAISHLEDELKLQLFVRQHARGLALTAAGKQIMREAKLLLRHADSLYDMAGNLHNEISGHFAIGCMVTLAPMIVPELGHLFTSSYPDVKLSLCEGSHEQLIDMLRQVEIDAAISYDMEFPEEVVFEALAQLPPHIQLPRSHRLATRRGIELRELEGEPLILLDLPYSRQYFLSLFQRHGWTPRIYSRSGSPEVVRTMVANGYGYTIANVRPRNLVSLDGKELALVPLEGDHLPMTIGVATLKQESKPRLLEAFEQHCRQTITQDNIPGMASMPEG